MNMDKFIEACRKAPRVNEMADFFSLTAAGKENVPIKGIYPDARLFDNDKKVADFSKVLNKNIGPFVRHYFSSIPYSLEEECRLGSTICQYFEEKDKSDFFDVYCLGMAEGTMARTISEVSKGKIRTLTSSPTKINEKNFYMHGEPYNSFFIHSPFFLITKNSLGMHDKLSHFKCGFDLLIEDTTFQMYSREREEKIQFVSELIKPDGLAVFTEKCSCDSDEYTMRELQKDYSFKHRFFSDDDLQKKKEIILCRMNKNEATVDEVDSAIRKFFNYSVIIWNSGNFYTFLAGNSYREIKKFVSKMIQPCIPHEYVYCDLPNMLSTDNVPPVSFRMPVF
ncbi:hypothetical protein H4F66_13865 [Pectobacterium parmentieri]|nr:hypothetical protein C5E25_02585 [Pectobacterium parmentieri]AYH13166.1 hypothetical protein C5E23_02570 [Pectobacterium parmentieri]AYH21868.1 hypothetical protein C5E21_02565 [Pectobacterium parmentieri]MBN3178636.1 hypothetical protein [Pectobacterium parmentieri]POW24302.1 hypothetical protein PB20LOC_04006 [Pectobacterium parmentieri]